MKTASTEKDADSARTVSAFFAQRTGGSYDDVSLDQPLTGEGLNRLKFPQMGRVHLRMWVPQQAGTVQNCIAEDNPASGAPGPRAKVEEKTEQGIRNRVYDFAAQEDGITLPPLQFSIDYCFSVQACPKDKPGSETLHHGYFMARVAWPLKAGTSWWADRYVSASVGVGFSGWSSWTSNSFDSTPSPYVFAGVLITPCPTDRRWPYADRVHGSAWQHVGLLVAAALMNPWPNANVPKSLGASGLVLGAGYTFGDNILGLSAGVVMGRADYTEHDNLGISHDQTALLVAPTLTISTQADIVSIVNSIIGGKL